MAMRGLLTIVISIHAPRTGSDQLAGAASGHPLHFNPRSPHGERRALDPLEELFNVISIHAPRTGSDRDATAGRIVVGISIHAPRTGSDAIKAFPWEDTGTFQSTLPARGATRCASEKGCRPIISIHAPRTGSDV